MRIRTLGVISVVAVAVAVAVAATVAVYAADQPADAKAKPEWRAMKVASGEVVIFGNVKRPGFYATPKEGMSLKQLVSAAGGVEKPEAAVVHVRRYAGEGEAKFVEVKANALAEDGGIALEPRDIIEVSDAAAAR